MTTQSDSVVFIIDDDAAIRDSLSLMIQQAGIDVQTFDSAESFLGAYQTTSRGCAIIDIRMLGMDGLKLHETLMKEECNLPVIFLTGHGDIAMGVEAMKAGAVDFLTKPVTRQKLLSSIKLAIDQSIRISLEKASHLEALTRLNSLTKRERDVLWLAIEGKPNKHIARTLGISHRTVEIHKSKIMQKTGALNLLDLVRIVREST